MDSSVAVGVTQKGNKTCSRGWVLHESDSLVLTKLHPIMTFFLFMLFEPFSGGDLEWELDRGALGVQMALK